MCKKNPLVPRLWFSIGTPGNAGASRYPSDAGSPPGDSGCPARHGTNARLAAEALRPGSFDRRHPDWRRQPQALIAR